MTTLKEVLKNLPKGGHFSREEWGCGGDRVLRKADSGRNFLCRAAGGGWWTYSLTIGDVEAEDWYVVDEPPASKDKESIELELMKIIDRAKQLQLRASVIGRAVAQAQGLEQGISDDAKKLEALLESYEFDDPEETDTILDGIGSIIVSASHSKRLCGAAYENGESLNSISKCIEEVAVKIKTILEDYEFGDDE